ncbi:unnamed protein product [Trichobilharzia szidati]|nr:unnamed protein product [Trichobilharzia szidati]
MASTWNNLLPRRICVPRKSVSSDHSSWVKSFGPTGDLPPKRHSSSRLTTTSGVQKISKLYEDQNCINISPPSSPEQDVLEFRHELLNIEDPFPLDSELQQLQNLRSDHCSSSVVSQNEGSTICESSQPDYVTELQNTDEQTNLDSSFESLCYLTELQRDNTEIPYASLCVKSLPRRVPPNSMLRKLHHLLKRKSSERCVWLHQRSTQRTQVSFNHVSKAFQILKVFRSPNGLSGLVAFGVREIISNLEAKIENQNEEQKDESNCFGVLLLPTSGIPSGMEAVFSSTTRNPFLGDSLKCGDCVAVFGPWSTYHSREFDNLPVMHSFFWVERIKSEALVGNNFPDFHTNFVKPQLITCPCLSSCDPHTVLSCPSRFRVLSKRNLLVISGFEDSSQDVSATLFDRKCVLVLGCHRFWLLNKLRPILLVWHFGGYPGLILLPNREDFTGNLSKCDITYQDFRLGYVYTTEALLQLPSEQLPEVVHKEIINRLNEIESYLDKKYASNLKSFIRGSTAHNNDITDELFFGNTECNINFWEARVSHFNLVESNYIHLNSSISYKISLADSTRCSISGSLLIEPPEGSLSKDIILDCFNTECKKLQLSSKHNMILGECLTDIQKVARVFYLWLSESITPILLPCICLVDIVSPMELIYQKMFTMSTVVDQSSGFGVYMSIDQAIVFGSFIVLDRFASLTIEDHTQHVLKHSLRSSLCKQIYTNSIILQSSKDLNTIRVHQMVFFSGTLIRVDTSRSHVWPTCPYCACANFEIHSNVNDKIAMKSESLKCIRCSALLSNPLQQLEIEVQVLIDGENNCKPMRRVKEDNSPMEITLNMAPWRLCKLLNVTQSNLLTGTGLNPKDLINRRLDNVCAIVVHIPNKLTVNDDCVRKRNMHLKNLYAIELDQININRKCNM